MKICSIVTIDYGGYTSSISEPLERFQKGFGTIIENSLEKHSSSDCTCKKNDVDFSGGRLGEFYTEKKPVKSMPHAKKGRLSVTLAAGRAARGGDLKCIPCSRLQRTHGLTVRLTVCLMCEK